MAMATSDEKSAAISSMTASPPSNEPNPTYPENRAALEKRTIRKFDFFVLPQFMILILVAYIDRSNIGPYSFSDAALVVF